MRKDLDKYGLVCPFQKWRPSDPDYCTGSCALYMDKGCAFVSIADSLDKLAQTTESLVTMNTGSAVAKSQIMTNE